MKLLIKSLMTKFSRDPMAGTPRNTKRSADMAFAHLQSVGTFGHIL
jgi:hypothetical protein